MLWTRARGATRWRCNMMHGSTSSLYDHHRASGMLRRSARPAVTTCGRHGHEAHASRAIARSEEHTSELQSLMRLSYAVFCLKKKKASTDDHPIISPISTRNV